MEAVAEVKKTHGGKRVASDTKSAYIRGIGLGMRIRMSKRATNVLDDIAEMVGERLAATVQKISMRKRELRRCKTGGGVQMRVLQAKTVGAALLIELGGGTFASDANLFGRTAIGRYESTRSPRVKKTVVAAVAV